MGQSPNTPDMQLLVLLGLAATATALPSYVHEEIPAEPYIHEEIPAEPYVHIEPPIDDLTLGIIRPNQQQQVYQQPQQQVYQQPQPEVVDAPASPGAVRVSSGLLGLLEVLLGLGLLVLLVLLVRPDDSQGEVINWWLDVKVGLGRDLLVDVRLGGDLLVHVRRQGGGGGGKTKKNKELHVWSVLGDSH